MRIQHRDAMACVAAICILVPACFTPDEPPPPYEASTGTGGGQGGGAASSGTGPGSGGGGQGDACATAGLTGPDPLLRYFLDEPSGDAQSSGTVDLDLAVEGSGIERIDDGTMHAGLHWNAAATDARLSAQCGGALGKHDSMTLELVVDIKAVREDGSMLFFIGSDNANNGALSMNVYPGNNGFELSLRGEVGGGVQEFGRWEVSSGSDRIVLHATLDTTVDNGSAALYVDGQMQTMMMMEDAPAFPAAEVDLDAESYWCVIGNRENGIASDPWRSFQGALTYAAFYGDVLNQADIEDHVQRLRDCDDRPE